MEWEPLLSEFRALGGVAENVRPGEGPFGRGLFAIDPSRPVNVHASRNVMIPVEDLEVRDDRLAIRAGSAVGQRARDFFLNLQIRFGWDAALFDDLWKRQLAWSRLAPPIVAEIHGMGTVEDPEHRFVAPIARKRVCTIS